MITKLRAQELYRSFVRSRQDAIVGWPDRSVYSEEDCRYFDTLEQERLAGRLQVEGRILTLEDLPDVP